MTNTNLRLIKEIEAIVRRAGDIIVTHSTQAKQIEFKGEIDLVTQTDLAVEDYLQMQLAPLAPGVEFIAEESSNGRKVTDNCWIIDPVDGTTNFAHGIPLVAVSVALRLEGETVAGIVHAPLLGSCFTALRGRGAWHNGVPMRVSEETELQRALIATGFPYAVKKELPYLLARLERVLPACQGVRRCGAAALDLAWVAAGRYEGYYETRLRPWDIAAGCLLVQEAGGKTTSLSGAPLCLDGGEVLATNGKIHLDLKRLVREEDLKPNA